MLEWLFDSILDILICYLAMRLLVVAINTQYTTDTRGNWLLKLVPNAKYVTSLLVQLPLCNAVYNKFSCKINFFQMYVSIMYLQSTVS